MCAASASIGIPSSCCLQVPALLKAVASPQSLLGAVSPVHVPGWHDTSLDVKVTLPLVM